MPIRIVQLARILALLACGAVAAATAATGQQGTQPPTQQQAKAPITPLAELDPIKFALDQIEATLRRENLSPETLGDLDSAVAPARDNLRAKVADLETRFAQADDRRKQIGAPPVAGAPAESPAIATERARLNQAYGDLDDAVKQGRLLLSRADALASQVMERRRDLFAQRLAQRTSSVLDPFFWLDVAKTLPGEARSFGILLQSWGSYAWDRGGLPRLAAAAATLLVLSFGFAAFVRWWRRRFGAQMPRETRSAKAIASLGAFVRGALKMPLIVIAIVQILEAFELVPQRFGEISQGLMIAVIVAAFGRGVAIGALAPGRPDRRLPRLGDRAADSLYAHMTWAARALGLAIFLLTLHRAVVAAPTLVVATRVLLSLAVCGLLIHLLLDLRQPHDASSDDVAPPRLWIRALAWLVAIGIAVSLVGGFAGLGYFLSERLLSTAAIVGAIYLLIAASDALFADYFTSETPRGRGIAINLGLNPRNVGLLATLVAGATRVLLIVIALVLLVGPWQISTASFIERVRNITVGFEIGGITFSFGTVLGAAIVMVIILVVTRAIQRWLERQLLPRTALDPSLQLSIVTIFGYLGVIAAIAFAMGQLGIDLQKIAFIAGALSVGIGFGLQSIVSNFVSGLILLAERPIRVGDRIVVKGEEGKVRRISVRATEIETFDQGSVIVPNTELITGMVKNWTHMNAWGRIVIKIGVGYDSDPEQVRDILLDCSKQHPEVIKSSDPSVQLAAFGDSALQFEVYAVIIDIARAGNVKSDIHFAILRRFREAGISIPYPQQEVRLLGEAANGGGPGGGDAAPAPAAAPPKVTER